jgi:hypothetical protein
MINEETMAYLEKEHIPYILGARLRRVKEIREEVLSRAGRYREVYPEGVSSKDPSSLKVQGVLVDNRRYIVCLNDRQARKDSADRQAITDALKEKIKSDPKSLVGNKGYRQYLKIDRDSVSIRGAIRREVGSQDQYHAYGGTSSPQVQRTLECGACFLQFPGAGFAQGSGP